MLKLNDSCRYCDQSIRLWITGKFKGKPFKIPVLGCSRLEDARIETGTLNEFHEGYFGKAEYGVNWRVINDSKEERAEA